MKRSILPKVLKGRAKATDKISNLKDKRTAGNFYFPKTSLPCVLFFKLASLIIGL